MKCDYWYQKRDFTCRLVSLWSVTIAYMEIEISPVDICTYIMASCREEIQMYQWLFFRQGALYSVHINNSQKRLLVFTHLFMCMLQWSEIVVQKTWARRNKCSHGDCMWCMPRADWASDTQFQLRLRCLMWNRSNHLPVDSVPVDVSANYQWMWTLHGCMSVPAMAMRTWMDCF